MGFLKRFMVQFGLLSSVFDLLTFGLLLWLFAAGAELFRTGWFVESLLTELLVALIVRTRRPFWKSRPGSLLLWSTLAVIGLAFAIPYLPYAGLLGFTPLPRGWCLRSSQSRCSTWPAPSGSRPASIAARDARSARGPT